MTDDQGVVCPAEKFDYKTGCCSSGEKHFCGKCNPVDNCCEGFESCVSCCMAPASKPEERIKEVHVIRNDPKSPLWPDSFEYCRDTCRTHVWSTSHENAYISSRHHCFSSLGKPLLDPPVPQGALDGIKVILSVRGTSCQDTCAKEKLACSPQHFQHLNACDRLREVTNCEAGCVKEELTPLMPLYVDPEAPKGSRPAICVVGQDPNQKEGFSCSKEERYTRRLCPCAASAGDQPSAGGA